MRSVDWKRAQMRFLVRLLQRHRLLCEILLWSPSRRELADKWGRCLRHPLTKYLEILGRSRRWLQGQTYSISPHVQFNQLRLPRVPLWPYAHASNDPILHWRYSHWVLGSWTKAINIRNLRQTDISFRNFANISRTNSIYGKHGKRLRWAHHDIHTDTALLQYQGNVMASHRYYTPTTD